MLASQNLERMEKAVGKIAPKDSGAIRRFLEDNRIKMERFRPCLESPFLSWRDLLTPRLLGLLPLLKPWRSLDSELRRYFSDERVRLAFSFQSKYLGMSPFRCPSLFSILSFLEYEYGVFHPIGGCGAVSVAMARVAEKMGVKIRLGEEVEQLIFKGKRVIGAKTKQGQYSCDAMVINADFSQAMKRLVPNELRVDWSDERLMKKEFSCSTFMLYLGVKGRFDELTHHTIYLAKNYCENLKDIEDSHVLSNDPSFYVQNATQTDHTLAPQGMSTLYVLLPVTHQHPNVDWQKEKPRFRALALQQLKKIGIKDIESRIVVEKVITPDDWQAQQIYRGATFNMAHNLSQMLHLRPGNRFRELDGVYLVGGGTHPGSGLPVIYSSARISSKLLLQDFGMNTDWLDVPATRPNAANIQQVA